jgi:transposase
MNYIGMDLHHRQSTYCVVDEAGAIVGRGRVESTVEGWNSLYRRWPASEVRLAVETGAQTWSAVDCARAAGIEPVVVDARQFKLVASSKKKCDRRDAFHLADALRAGLAQRCSVTVPSARARSGRGLLQARMTVVKQCTISRNAACGLLRAIGIRISAARFASDPRWQEVLTKHPIPESIRRLLEIHRHAWKELQARRKELDALAEAELKLWPEAEHLQEIAGYGPIVTLSVASSVDDPKRFRTEKQVASYAGIVPTVRASGDSNWHGGITHEGRVGLRVAMVQAAHSALRSKKLSPALKRWAGRLLARKGCQIAAVALARRLLMLGYKLLRTGEHYNPNYGLEVTT